MDANQARLQQPQIHHLNYTHQAQVQDRTRIIHKPLIVGTHAIYLPKSRQKDQTHKWCCYVRSTQPTAYISKVEFTLDESFGDMAHIVLTQPPYEVHQMGWGEFTIGIRIHFHKPHDNKPVEIGKQLVLYDDMPVSAKRPIIREDYNELIFVEPSDNMMNLLSQRDPAQEPVQESIDDQLSKIDELTKPIDRALLVKGYQDRLFEEKESQSLKLLQNAV